MLALPAIAPHWNDPNVKRDVEVEELLVDNVGNVAACTTVVSVALSAAKVPIPSVATILPALSVANTVNKPGLDKPISPGTEMFQFSGLVTDAYVFSVRLFGYPGINACLTASPGLSQSSTPFITF